MDGKIERIEQSGFTKWSKDFRTVKEFAEYLGVGERHVHKIKAGEAPVSSNIILKYIEYQKEKMI